MGNRDTIVNIVCWWENIIPSNIVFISRKSVKSILKSIGNSVDTESSIKLKGNPAFDDSIRSYMYTVHHILLLCSNSNRFKFSLSASTCQPKINAALKANPKIKNTMLLYNQPLANKMHIEA